MRKLSFVLLLLSSFLLAQESNPSQQNSKTSKGQITVQGCVSRSSGDYILMKHDPTMSYQLHATSKISLAHYLGQQVEVTGGGITLDEHEFQSLRKNRFAVGSFSHNLDQDHRETMFRAIAPI